MKRVFSILAMLLLVFLGIRAKGLCKGKMEKRVKKAKEAITTGVDYLSNISKNCFAMEPNVDRSFQWGDRITLNINEGTNQISQLVVENFDVVPLNIMKLNLW